jgi:hypothetical protein
MACLPLLDLNVLDWNGLDWNGLGVKDGATAR